MTPFDLISTHKTLSLPEVFSNSNISLYSYGRYAFYEFLKTTKIKTIYIPAFICRDMLSPINTLKIKYYFYDVNENLEPILDEVVADAILSVNYFGFPQKLGSFFDYCQKYNALLVEDNAHGFLSQDDEQKHLGTRGDFGLLSLRKTIFLPNGAALLINNNNYKDISFNSPIIEESYEDENYNKKINLKRIISNISPRLGILILQLRRLLRYVKTGQSIPKPDEQSEINLPNAKLTPLLKNCSLNIDINFERHRRIQMYKIVEKYSHLFKIKPIYKSLNEYTVPYAFAFMADEAEKEKFEKYLLKKNFFILPWPDLPNEVVNDCKQFYKNVWMVPFLW